MATPKKSAPKKAAPKDASTVLTDKAAKFKHVAKRRVVNAIKQISLLGNLSNTSSYEFTSEQIEKLFALIADAAKKSQSRFVAKEKDSELEFDF